MQEAGQKLRRARERLKLRYRDVEQASQRLAEHHGNNEFLVGLSRLADIENKGTVPSFYRLYSLCAIYKLNFAAVLRWYGINLDELPADATRFALDTTTVFDTDISDRIQLDFPLALSAEFDLRRTSYLGDQIERWGRVSLGMLKNLNLRHGRYALMGTEDWSMSPLIPPGSFLQLDERRRRVEKGEWDNEFERPIYFLEHRNGYQCGWCNVRDNVLIVQSHPSYDAAPQMYELSGEVDILGQVVGVAMRLDQAKVRRTRS